MLTWDKLDERYYEHGLDRGVAYIPSVGPVPWNGLTGVDEGGDSAGSILYRDGVVYLADSDASDFKASARAYFFPDELNECLGIPEVTPGLYVDSQKPKPFGMSYRTLIGSGAKGDEFGFQIHLIYNIMATIGMRSRKTLGATVELVEFTFDFVCTPVKLTGYRPTAHYIVDTRNLSPERLADIETMLYGSDTTPGQLPTTSVLFNMVTYGPDEIMDPITEPL